MSDTRTLGTMKAKIALEFRRDDLSTDIANAITTAIDAYKYEAFPFNRETFVDAPTDDTTTDNAWMTTAERLIRCRAKLEVGVNVIGYASDNPFVSLMQQEIADALQAVARQSGPERVQSRYDGRDSGSNAAVSPTRSIGEIWGRRSRCDFGCDRLLEWERYFFNETRDQTFTTSDGVDSYGVNEFNDILNVIKIDYVIYTADAQYYDILPRFPLHIERAIQSGSPSREFHPNTPSTTRHSDFIRSPRENLTSGWRISGPFRRQCKTMKPATSG